MGRIWNSFTAACVVGVSLSTAYHEALALGSKPNPIKEYTGLKKMIGVLPVDIKDFPLPGGATGRIGAGFREAMKIALAESGRYRVDSQLPLSADQWNPPLTPDGSAPPDNLCYRPQYYYHVEVISYELKNLGLGISVGYSGDTVFTPGLVPGGKFKIDFARLDLAVSIMDPYTLQPIHTITMYDLQPSIDVDIMVTVDGVGIGFNLEYNKPLMQLVIDMLKKGMKSYNDWIDSKPFEARMLKSNDGYVTINAGQDANLSTGLEFISYRAEIIKDEGRIYMDLIKNGNLKRIDHIGPNTAAGWVTGGKKEPKKCDLVREVRF